MPNHLKTSKRVKFFSIIAIVLVLVAVGAFIHERHKPHATHAVSYGLALGYTLPGMTNAQRLAELSKIKGLGFDEVRYNLDWSQIQSRGSTTYDWKLSDTIMKDVQQSGLKSVITLDRTPTWARPANCTTDIFCAPANVYTFAKFAGAAANRYKHYNVSAWEIWNEPNIVNFWKPFPDPVQYATMLKASYTAIKQQDQTATVVVGGLAGNAIDEGQSYMDPRTFLTVLYSQQAVGHFDGVAYHPYTTLRLPDNRAPHNGWPKMNQTHTSIRSIMAAHGDSSKGVWITEFGAATDGPGTTISMPGAKEIPTSADHVTLSAQAQIAQQAITAVKAASWVKDFDWYTYQDSSSAPTTAENFYGMLDAKGNQKPVYKTILNAIE